ncbi:uncharacterized protein LOC128218516 [Mya arenaria]|uniref:uncharacterized protein LOC128218516 n=1 Tax=Mya arenaria TaxID=6604 RepID=UPI0022E387ED|nr:uncharacterized protein LOC128218516 [Mya arenaria]
MERCEKHPGKALELVCVDHDKLCCPVCVAVGHRQCASILHIPDVAKGIRKDPMFTQLPKEVADLRKQLEDMEDARTKNSASLWDTRAVIVDENKTIRENINASLDKMEKTTVDELDSLIAKHETVIKKDIDFCKQMHEDLKSLMDAIENKKSSGEPTLYIGVKKCGDKMNEARAHVHRMSSVETYYLTYQPDKTIEKWFSSPQSFGVLNDCVTVAAQFPQEHVFQVLGSKEYNVKMSSETLECDIGGVCELPCGQVVITDRNHSKVKLLDREYLVVDVYDVARAPWGVCHICGDEVAVCVNYFDQICELQFMYVAIGKLFVRRKLSFNHKCFAAAYHGDQLYISSGTALYVYTMSGQLVKKLYEDKTESDAVEKCVISNDGKRIYITNPSKNQLITLDNMGNTLATFTDPDMIQPTGIDVSPAGHVFVCAWDSKTVLQVDKDGKTKLTTLAKKVDGVSCPKALFFSSRTSCLFVGRWKDTLLVIMLQ